MFAGQTKSVKVTVLNKNNAESWQDGCYLAAADVMLDDDFVIEPVRFIPPLKGLSCREFEINIKVSKTTQNFDREFKVKMAFFDKSGIKFGSSFKL